MEFHTYYVANAGVLVHNKCKSYKSGYKPTEGGGGVTNSIEVGDKTVTFGHGGRHLEECGLTTTQVEQAIANDVVTKQLTIGKRNPFFINVNGIILEYGAWWCSEFLINVGSYFVSKQ